MSGDHTQLSVDAGERLAEAQSELRDALMAGQDTAPIRRRLAVLESALSRAVAAEEQAATEIEERQADEIAQAARTIADAVLIGISTRLAALKPTPLPASSR